MSNDLISRNKLLDEIRDFFKGQSAIFQATASGFDEQIEKMIMEQPVAYDLDKVVEQLEQQKNQYFRRSEEIKSKFGENAESQRNYSKACSYEFAAEIIKSGRIEP